MELIERLKGGIIVSCQSSEGSPVSGPVFMSAMAKAAEMAGAVGIRANGPEDIKTIRKTVALPIIGIYKRPDKDDQVYITPTLQEVDAIYQAGSDIVAIDATLRPRKYGTEATQLVQEIRQAYPRLLIMADISTVEEGVAAAQAGVDLVATTLSGYTPYSPQAVEPDFELIEALSRRIGMPVVTEGRISTPQHVARAFECGAHAVVIGTAITDPLAMAKRFVAASELLKERSIDNARGSET